MKCGFSPCSKLTFLHGNPSVPSSPEGSCCLLSRPQTCVQGEYLSSPLAEQSYCAAYPREQKPRPLQSPWLVTAVYHLCMRLLPGGHELCDRTDAKHMTLFTAASASSRRLLSAWKLKDMMHYSSLYMSVSKPQKHGF